MPPPEKISASRSRARQKAGAVTAPARFANISPGTCEGGRPAIEMSLPNDFVRMVALAGA
jgi:hypothetical protein